MLNTNMYWSCYGVKTLDTAGCQGVAYKQFGWKSQYKGDEDKSIDSNYHFEGEKRWKDPSNEK